MRREWRVYAAVAVVVGAWRLKSREGDHQVFKAQACSACTAAPGSATGAAAGAGPAAACRSATATRLATTMRVVARRPAAATTRAAAGSVVYAPRHRRRAGGDATRMAGVQIVECQHGRPTSWGRCAAALDVYRMCVGAGAGTGCRRAVGLGRVGGRTLSALRVSRSELCRIARVAVRVLAVW
eukprot:360861-Chlamydomonas_euryale.AAC.6